MRRVQLSGVALLLAVCTGAWAGEGDYFPNKGYEHVSSRTRAQVITELREAQRLGLMWSIESDFPNVNLSDASVDKGVLGDPRLLRAKIRAETNEAGRLGLLRSSEGTTPVATAEQKELIAAAGRRAVENFLHSQRLIPAALN